MERIKRLLAYMGNPERGLPCIHVGGTNGKGSTSLIIAALFTAGGYKVGRFSSPHLHSYTERFSINGKGINHQRLLGYLDDIQLEMERMISQGYPSPTEFEVLTAAAFKYFHDEGVDLAVIEVGMGGRYDSTNVILPLVSIITNIDYDHTDYLGQSLQDIALNKAGIIKPHIPVVMGEMPEKAAEVIINEADRLSAPLSKASAAHISSSGLGGLKGQWVNISGCDTGWENVFFSLPGGFQLQNLATAITAIRILDDKGFRVNPSDVRQGLGCLSMPGRLEMIREQPPVIVDVAHNPHGSRALASALHELLPGRGKILVIGMLDDKDVSLTLESLGDGTRECIITRPEGGRSSEWKRVSRAWQELYPHKNSYEEENIVEALKTGINRLREDEYLLVTGSFYVLNQARKYLLSF